MLNFAGAGTKSKETDILELIAFRIGEQEFCIDVMAVREIRGWTSATPLPHAPHYMQGVINLRGAVLSVVDLAALLGFRATEPTQRHVTIVVEVGQAVVGLLVDAVLDILKISSAEIQPTPSVASDMAETYVKGVIAVEQRMIGLLAVDAILPELKAAEAA